MASLASLPVELLTNILSLAIEPVWIEDHAVVGLGMPTHRLAQVSRAWRDICLGLPAQVPMKKKKKKKRKDGGRRDESWEPEVTLLDDPLEPEEEKQRKKDAAAVKSSRLAIHQVLVWQDLTQAARCIRSNRNNVDFWTNVRAIFLTVLEVYNTPDRRYYELGLCHWVFRDLYAILYKLLPSQGLKPPLRWLRLQLAVWQGLSKSDPLFYLSRMHSIPFVRFHACYGSSINNYIGKIVRDSVRPATARRPARGCTVPWVPLEDMEPGKAGYDWKRSALKQWQKRRGKGDSESEVYVAYLVKRYDVKYRSFKPID